MGKGKVERLMRRLKEFKKANGVDKMILFGSFARGDFRKDSDVDLIVVDKKFSKLGRFERGKGFWISWHEKHKIPHPVDFIFYSPKEFEKLSKEVSIVSEALREGIEV